MTRTTTVSGEATTVSAAADTVTDTVTVTTTKKRPKPPPAKSHTYTGSGGSKIRIVVSRSGDLHWTATGGVFQVWTLPDIDIWVNSQASSGRTFVSAGHYLIQVNAIGSWTLKTP